MAEEIVLQIPDPIVVEVGIEPAIEVIVAQPDAALNLHLNHQGRGGHVPAVGISDVDIAEISQSKITDLTTRLNEIESTIAEIRSEASRISFTLVDLSSPDYYYYGGSDSIGAWQVNRFDQNAGLLKSVARVGGNGNYGSLEEAWMARSILEYS